MAHICDALLTMRQQTCEVSPRKHVLEYQIEILVTYRLSYF